MAAPTLVGAADSATFGLSSSWVLSLANGRTAGNTNLAGFTQTQATQRTVTSISDGSANAYSEEKKEVSAGSGDGGSFIWKCAQMANSVSAGGTLQINFSGNTVGDACSQEITPATSAALTDSVVESVAATNHTSGATGLTTSGDVFVLTVGCANGNMASTTAGANYNKLLGTTRSMVQYRASNTGLTTDTGPWSNTTSRISKGVMAAFYAVGGAPRRFLLVRP